MTGRGKEGKGLRKGGAKRHRKELRDNIQGIKDEKNILFLGKTIYINSNICINSIQYKEINSFSHLALTYKSVWNR